MPTNSLFFGGPSRKQDTSITCFFCHEDIHLNHHEYKGFREEWFLWRCPNPRCRKWLQTADPLPFDFEYWHKFIPIDRDRRA